MEIDGRTLALGSLDADVCVVGAGPAGLTLATALSRHGRRTVVLESGDRTTDSGPQALSAGTTSGDAYAGPATTRHRGAGGTVAMWNTFFEGVAGAKYVPLSPVDLETRAWWPMSGWPFEAGELARYYGQAHSLCGLGPATYRAEDWATAGRACLPLAPDRIVTGVYQFGASHALAGRALEALRRADNVVVCFNSSMVGVELDAAGRTIRRLRAATLTGRTLFVHARHYVLAAGGIENARLLLCLAQAAGLPDTSGLLGRCFMEHPRDLGCHLVPADPGLLDHCGFYDLHRAAAGVVAGHLTFADTARRDQELPAMAVSLLPVPRPLRWARAERWRARLTGQRAPSRAGWWRGPGTSRHYAAVALLINLEQAPDPDNRITLGRERDAFGLPRAEVHWRWRPHDRASLARVRAVVGRELERHGLGRVVAAAEALPDPNAHHHLGTTRMHRDPRLGVLDADGLLHGVSNMFVTGSSVFPTGGFANPTLTVVALALRLADHLDRRLASETRAAPGDWAIVPGT